MTKMTNAQLHNENAYLKVSLMEAAESLIRAGWKIAAIKAYRSATGADLKEAIIWQKDKSIQYDVN